MKSRNRLTAFATLLMACVLLPAGSLLNSHDENEPPGDHHHCVVCCHHHCVGLVASVSAPATLTTKPERVGVAYQLENGEIIYVPEAT